MRVYNFGAGDYYSTQERILFERLISHGHIPHIAVFMNGLNYFKRPDDVPVWTGRQAAYINRDLGLTEAVPSARASRRAGWGRILEGALECRAGLANRLRSREQVGQIRASKATVGDGPGHAKTSQKQNSLRPESLARGNHMLSQYLAHIKMIDLVSSGFGVSTFHAFQPIFKYNHRLSSNPFEQDADLSGIGTRRKDYHTTAYEQMKELVSTPPPSPGFIWAADLNEAETGIMYVDRLHYSPVMSDRLAGFVARHISDTLDASTLPIRKSAPPGSSIETIEDHMRASKGADS